MKEKQITLKVKGITHKQWSNLLLELNLIKKAWKSYGVDINLNAPGLRNVLSWGTRVHDYIRPTRRAGKSVSQNKGS